MPTREAAGEVPLILAVDPLKVDNCSLPRSVTGLADPGFGDDRAVSCLDVPAVLSDGQSDNQSAVGKKNGVGTGIRDFTSVRVPTYVSIVTVMV
jgi:hypothetical protein